MSGITDLAVLVIPIPLIWNLHMPLRKKIRVLGLLGAGGIAVAASLARLVMVVQGVGDPDLTWSIVRFNLLGYVFASLLWKKAARLKLRLQDSRNEHRAHLRLSPRLQCFLRPLRRQVFLIQILEVQKLGRNYGC